MIKTLYGNQTKGWGCTVIVVKWPDATQNANLTPQCSLNYRIKHISKTGRLGKLLGFFSHRFSHSFLSSSRKARGLIYQRHSHTSLLYTCPVQTAKPKSYNTFQNLDGSKQIPLPANIFRHGSIHSYIQYQKEEHLYSLHNNLKVRLFSYKCTIEKQYTDESRVNSTLGKKVEQNNKKKGYPLFAVLELEGAILRETCIISFNIHTQKNQNIP